MKIVQRIIIIAIALVSLFFLLILPTTKNVDHGKADGTAIITAQ